MGKHYDTCGHVCIKFTEFLFIYIRLTITLFAMAKIQKIGHDHQAPFWLVVVCIVLLYCCIGISSGDTRQKQATTWPIYLGPPIFLQILNLLVSD